VLQGSLLTVGELGVDDGAAFERIALDERSWVDISRGWLRGADDLLDELVDTVPWRRGRRWMYDREVDDPRLMHWARSRSDDPHRVLGEIRRVLERRYRVPLERVGLNYYRDGRDSVAFHRDRELRHLDDTLIAIVTLGAQRPFKIRPLGGGRSVDVSPASGDLLVMGGRCQREWEHAVPKTARPVGPRISASYRWTAGTGSRDDGDGYFSSRRWRPADR
jgi:alkylated DNA repair dioxygenase AlkB